MQRPERTFPKRRARVYPALRQMCLDYQFWPRQQLHIEDLAGMLSSSATPVREALARLAGEGLIESVPNRGYVAKALSEDEMRDCLDLLFTLLRDSVKRSLPESWAQRVTPGAGFGDDVHGALTYVDETLTMIARLSDNDVLRNNVVRLLELTRYVRRVDLEDPSTISLTRLAFFALREALSAGDRPSVLDALHEQYRNVQHRLARVVKEGQSRTMSRQRAAGVVRNALIPGLPAA